MNITSGQKKLLLLGILVIAGGAAFVFFDPLGLGLLGQKKAPAVVAPKAPPRPVLPGVKSNVTAPASAPVASAPAAAQVVAKAAQVVPLPMKPTEPDKTESKRTHPGKGASIKPKKPRDADLRDCLKLESNAAIVKCAEE